MHYKQDREMKHIKMTFLGLILFACSPLHIAATELLGLDLQDLSVFSNTYTTTGADSTVYGNILTGDVGTSGAGGTITGSFTAVGAVTLGGISGTSREATVSGDIISGGVLTTGDHASVGGSATSGGAATIGPAGTVGGDLAAAGAITLGPDSYVSGSVVSGEVDVAELLEGLNYKVDSNQLQILAAQEAISKMVTTTELAATITTDITLTSGVYHAASLATTASTTITLDAMGREDQFWVFNIDDILTTGASTKIELINGADSGNIIWNSNGYTALGANSTFLGTLMSKEYISVGANAKAVGSGDSCGGLFSALSYVSAGKDAQIGREGCQGIASGFLVDPDGVAYLAASEESEPESGSPQAALPAESPSGAVGVPEPGVRGVLMFSFILMGLLIRRKKAKLVAAL